MPRCLALGLGRHGPLWARRPRHSHRPDVALVFARWSPHSRLAAGLGSGGLIKGLQPPRPRWRTNLDRLDISPSHARPEYQGRARGARPASDPQGAPPLRWSNRPALDCRHSRRLGGRSVGEIADRFSGAVGARRGRPRLPRETPCADRALPRPSPANPERGPPRSCAAFSRAQAFTGQAKDRTRMPRSTCSKSRTGFSSRPAASDVRPPCGSPPAFRSRSRLLHRLSCSSLHDPSPRHANGPVVAGRALTNGLLTRPRPARSRSQAVGFAVWIERLAARAGGS